MTLLPCLHSIHREIGMNRAFLVTSALLVAVCFIACSGSPAEPRGSVRESDQAERKAIIQELISKGVFKDVEFGHRAVVRVGPTFMGLDFKAKQDFISVVAAYQFKIPKGKSLAVGEVVRVVDFRTDKLVARYDSSGLTME